MKRSPILVSPNFEAPLASDLGRGQNPHGVICAANEARFTSAHLSEPLTALTIGWKDPEDIDGILQRLFPMVRVARRFSFRKAANAQAFLSETDDLRPIGSGFKQVAYSGESAESKTLNRGLTVRIDHDECDDLEAEVTLTVDRLMQRVKRNSLRRGFVLLDTADHAGGASSWKSDTSPDGLLRAMGKLSADTSGIYPNVYACGESAWHMRLDAYEASARTNPASGAALARTLQSLASYLNADVFEIVKARYQSSATAKTAVLAARVYAYLAVQGVGKDDPSAIKRFVSMTRTGGQFAVYREDEEKWTDVTIEHYENNVATGVGVESIDVQST